MLLSPFLSCHGDYSSEALDNDDALSCGEPRLDTVPELCDVCQPEIEDA